MLDVKKVQSTNSVIINGILKELNIEEKQTADGRGYVTGSALIKVEQEYNGVVMDNEIPVRMFSMRLKSDGNPNAVYDGIVKMKEDFISLAAAENPSQASRVSITSGQLQENMWIDKTTGQPRVKEFQISSNFMRKGKMEDADVARFELSGVVGNITDEVDKEGNETGRVVLELIVVGYAGKTDVLKLYTGKPEAANHIRTNWEKGDTVTLTGIVNMTYKVETKMVEQAFGDPIERRTTVSKKELIITGGCASGLDEDCSYDTDGIKIALNERQGRIDKLSEKKPATTPKAKKDLGF